MSLSSRSSSIRLPDTGTVSMPPADVHPHQVGHHLVADGQGGADGAAHPGVDIGHDADLAARREGLVAEGLDLAASARFQLIAEDSGGVVGSFDSRSSLILLIFKYEYDLTFFHSGLRFRAPPLYHNSHQKTTPRAAA